ncbi:hypothetical protein SLEP1_g3635 [Rubroshorea leprosula]|uniref:Uncharacterized protein n=1 Tax=Rubroshorea leprosula TaxID=152421 RepID=A0AAV5HTN7_9ROSI|nr:hypothetical protein SLEP1_g3635 [Rubroshorea leprosula]
MDFIEDTTRQGKRLREDVTSHSTAKKARESIFSVNTSKPDLKLLKEAYGLLSSREKHDFEHHFLRNSLAVDSCTFTPQAQHMKLTLEKVQEMLQAMWGFSFEFSQSLVTTRDNSYGFDWNAALMILGKRLIIAPMLVALFEQLWQTLTFNLASTVAHGHLRGPQFEALFNVPVKDRKTKDWHRSLLAATVNEVGFVLLTWNATHYLAPPDGYHSIPLLGIHGEVFKAHEMWEKCRMLPIWKEKGTGPQYEQWRSSWKAKLPLLCKVTNTKNSTIMDLTAKLELSHAKKCQLLEKYNELALDHELLKKGKELSDQQVAGLTDKIASLERDLAATNEQLGEQLQDMTISRDLYKIAIEDMCCQLQAEKQKNQALVEKDTNLHEVVINITALVTQFEIKILLIIAPRRKVFKKWRSPYLLRSRVIKMFQKNATTNLEKSVMDEKVDKLEATIQTMASTLQTINLTLSTLTIGSVPSLTSLIPTIPVLPVLTITPMRESSSHAPQISSLPFETSYPPFEMNNPTLPITSPLTFNIPPLMGLVPTIQPNPSAAMLRPTLKDGKSIEVDHKLQQFKQLDFDKYDGSGCPHAHLQMCARKVAPYANDERVLIHYFQDSLSGPASVWFLTLDKKKIRTFKDVFQVFMKQYKWRFEAAKVIPPLTDSEICYLFIKSTTGIFREWLAPCVGYIFAQLVTTGEQFEDGLKAVQANPVQPPYPYGYDPQAKCEYHNVTGHSTKYCTTLKHKIQDVIDEGKLQLDETKSAPNITQNPLPPHGASTMNMIALDEVDRPVLENAGSWSLDEMFAILIEYDLIQPIASISSNVSPVMINDALTSSVANSHFPYSLKVMPQRPVILNSTTNDVSNMTCSGRCYVNLEVEELRKAALKSKDIRIEEMPKESPKKLVSKNEVAKFLNILRKILKEAHVPKNIDTQKFGTMVGAILAPNYINFKDDEICDEGNGHTKALHIFVQCKMMNMPHVLIDNGSSLNVIPMIVLKQLKVDESHINQCNTVVHAFDETKRNMVGKIELLVEIGLVTFDVDFFVMNISPAFNMLLGRPWIHVAGAVPSTLHQKVKYIVNGVLVTVNGEEEHVIRRATAIPYLGVDPGTYESSYHSMECAATFYIHPKFRGKRAEMAKPAKVAAEIMLSFHYQLGEGLGLNGQGILKPVEFEEVVVEDINDEVCSDDEEDSFGFNNLFGDAEEDSFGFNNLFGPANMTDPKEIEEDNANFDPSHELTQMLSEEKPKLQLNQETETINLGSKDDRKEIKINAHLSTEERKELIELLVEFQNVFAWSYKDMSGLDPDIVVHAIPLYFGAKPIKQKLRRMRLEVLLKVKEEVQKLQDVNFIEIAMYLEWVANIVPIMKKDGRVRVCVDYRNLNKASPKDDFHCLTSKFC